MPRGGPSVNVGPAAQEALPGVRRFCAATLRSVTETQPKMIYRLVAEATWHSALAGGAFHGTAHDVRDGFIHFSSAAQVAETAARHYAGQSGLLLLGVSVDVLGEALRWEPSRGGALFPHLYASLPTSAVSVVLPLPLGADGVHVLPALE